MFARNALLLNCLLLIATGSLSAQQEIVLKSGAKLLGFVELKDGEAIVTIGDSKLTVPLAEIATIGPGAQAAAEPVRPADPLLLKALENQILEESTSGARSLLQEAAKLSPNDPRIAFWYARALLGEGHGAAAQQVYQAHRSELVVNYPGWADRLAADIQRRVKLEAGPPRFVQRIDAIEKSLAQGLTDSREPRGYTHFRLVDGEGKPIEKQVFQIRANGSDEQIESFGDGYFMVSFERSYGSSAADCKLIVEYPGFEPQETALPLTANSLEDAGEIVAQRLSESELLPFDVQVLSTAQTPIAGAVVKMRPAMSYSNNSSFGTDETTDEQGRLSLRLYPLRYSCSIQAAGYRAENHAIDLTGGKNAPKRFRVQLFAGLSGRVKVVWRSDAVSPEGGPLMGEQELVVRNGQSTPQRYDFQRMGLLQVIQLKDQLVLFAADPRMMNGPAQQPGWFCRVERKADESGAQLFDRLDVKKISAERATGKELELLPLPNYPPGAGGIAIAQDDVIVGQASAFNPQYGRPYMIDFKAYVVELSQPDKESPPAEAKSASVQSNVREQPGAASNHESKRVEK